MKIFMVKVVFKKSKISGYTWGDGSLSNIDCFVEIKAETLKEAVSLVEGIYEDKSKYWVKPGESYMKISFI